MAARKNELVTRCESLKRGFVPLVWKVTHWEIYLEVPGVGLGVMTKVPTKKATSLLLIIFFLKPVFF